MIRTRRNRATRLGAVAVEYALILPALLLMVLGLMDVGRLLWTYTTLTRAVEAAARCGAVDTTMCGTPAQIQSFGVREAWGLTIDTSAFTVVSAACGVQVKGAYDFTFIVPGFNFIVPLGTMTLNATACYPSQTGG